MMNVALGTSALWSGRIDDALGHAEAAIAKFPEGADSVGVVQALAREVERSCGAAASIRAFSCSSAPRRTTPSARPTTCCARRSPPPRSRSGMRRGPAVPRRVRRHRHRHRWRVGASCRARAGAPARRRCRCGLRATRCAPRHHRRHLVSLGMGGHGACVCRHGAFGRCVCRAVETSGRSTYSDRVLARLAGMCRRQSRRRCRRGGCARSGPCCGTGRRRSGLSDDRRCCCGGRGRETHPPRVAGASSRSRVCTHAARCAGFRLVDGDASGGRRRVGPC